MILQALVLIGVMMLHVVLYTGITWSLLAAVGGHATEAAFGVPPLLKWRVRDTVVTFGPIPNGQVTILGRAMDEPIIDDPRDWRRLGLGKRLVVLTTAWLITFAIAILCLGASRAVTSFVHGLYQGLFVLDLTPLARQLLALIATSPFHVTLGLVSAKLVAISALPFAGSTSGGLLLEFLGNRRTWWLHASMVILMFITARVVYAVIRVLIGWLP